VSVYLDNVGVNIRYGLTAVLFRYDKYLEKILTGHAIVRVIAQFAFIILNGDFNGFTNTYHLLKEKYKMD